MKITFGTLSVSRKAKDLVIEALNANRLSSGRLVREFEVRFAEIVGTRHAVAVSTGTDADALALAVLYDFGARRGDEVVVPALSFVSTGNAVLQAGLTPVFVDVDRETLNMDTSRLSEVLTSRTKAIMPVHLMGKPADMDPIREVADRHGLVVVEDAAEAHGATYKGRNAGAIGDMGAFSLYVAHIVSTVEGGIVTTDDPGYAEILRSLRSHGRACSCETCVLNVASGYCSKRTSPDAGDMRFVFERVGFSSKMNELEAAVGLGNLDQYRETLDRRRDNLYYLMERFRPFGEYLSTIHKEEHEDIGPHAFPIILTEKAKFSREKLAAQLWSNGVDTRTLFSSIPTQCGGYEFLGYRKGDFPNAEYIGDHGLHIGVHQDIDRGGCDHIVAVVERFLDASA